MSHISLVDFAQAAAELVISRLDEKYQLIHISQGDCLGDEQIRHLFAEEVDWDEVLDPEWESENRWHSTNRVLENLLENDAQGFLEEHGALDMVRDAIGDRDQSDPVGDLVGATGPKLFRYRLDAEAPHGPWQLTDEELSDAARALANGAGIDFWDNCAALRELVANASYGGQLYVLWSGDVKPVYKAVCEVQSSPQSPEITVEWTDPELLVLDQWNGSGYAVQVRGVVRAVLDLDRLSLDAARSPGGYSWTDVVGGGYRPDGDEPTFTYPTQEEQRV